MRYESVVLRNVFHFDLAVSLDYVEPENPLGLFHSCDPVWSVWQFNEVYENLLAFQHFAFEDSVQEPLVKSLSFGYLAVLRR